MKSKYDRPALKLEFFESEIDEVQEFLRWKFGENIAKSSMKNKCKWRPKEKQEHKKKILEDTLKENAKKQAKELSVPLEDLMKWKKAIIQLLLQQVAKYVNESRNKDWTINDVDIWNAEKILKMFKTELWEPSTIGTNYNLNANKIEWLTEEESEALDFLFWKSQTWKKSNK